MKLFGAVKTQFRFLSRYPHHSHATKKRHVDTQFALQKPCPRLLGGLASGSRQAVSYRSIFTHATSTPWYIVINW